MALDISTLTTYVDENKDSLISGAVAGAKSAQILNLQVGYKSSATINILDTDALFQSNAAGTGGRSANMTTDLTQRVLTVAPIKLEEDIDVRALNTVYLQHQLKAGSSDDEVPFEEAWTSLKVAKVASELEKAVWQGDTGWTVTNPNLSMFTGFLELFRADAEIVDVPLVGAATTNILQSDIITIMDNIYAAIPNTVLESGNVAIMCGFDTFRMYQAALKALNLFHYASDANGFEMNLAGTTVKIVALQGLSNTQAIVAGDPANFVIGTDLANEEEQFDIWYSKDDKVVKLDMAFKYGVQVAFPSEILLYDANPVIAS